MLAEQFNLDAFAVQLTDIREADVESLHALSMGVGWPHRAEDWQFLREVGHGLAAVDAIGRVYGSVMWFPYGTRFSTVGMLITSPRLQVNGGGKWLMSHVLERLPGRMIGLHATRAAHHLYRSLNFADQGLVHQHQGEAERPPESDEPASGEVRTVRPADADEIMALDRAALGLDRTTVLAAVTRRGEGTLLSREGRPVAFALCRPFGRGHVIGPVVAGSDADAVAVVRPLVEARASSFLRVDTPRLEGAFATFLSRCGLPVYDTVTRMSLGGSWTVGTPPDPAVYALSAHTTG